MRRREILERRTRTGFEGHAQQISTNRAILRNDLLFEELGWLGGEIMPGAIRGDRIQVEG